VLDPILKLEYLEVTWDETNLDVGIERFKSCVGIFKIHDIEYSFRFIQFLKYKASYEATQKQASNAQSPTISLSTGPGMSLSLTEFLLDKAIDLLHSTFIDRFLDGDND